MTVTRTEDKAATQGAFIGISKAIIDMGMTDIYQLEIAPVTFEATQTAPARGATVWHTRCDEARYGSDHAGFVEVTAGSGESALLLGR